MIMKPQLFLSYIFKYIFLLIIYGFKKIYSAAGLQPSVLHLKNYSTNSKN